MNLINEMLVLYLLKKVPDQHPFRLSRLLFLIDTECRRRHGKPCTDFDYVITPYGFYIEGFPPFLMSLDGVEKIEIKDEEGNPVRGFFRLVKDRDVELPDDILSVADYVIDKYANLDDQELNSAVVNLPEYQEHLSGDGG